MFYTIYKITNLLNGKYYIGKHQTKNLNDDYMGSGKLLKCAIEKHGVHNFKKEILHIFESEQEMNDKEKELVIISKETYNLCEGGAGGFSYINKTRDHSAHNKKLASKRDYSLTDKSYLTDEVRDGMRMRAKKMWQDGTFKYIPYTKGTKFSPTHKEKISQSQTGSKNSQYGTMWITDGEKSLKVKKDTTIPTGWRKGRVL